MQQETVERQRVLARGFLERAQARSSTRWRRVSPVSNLQYALQYRYSCVEALAYRTFHGVYALEAYRQSYGDSYSGYTKAIEESGRLLELALAEKADDNHIVLDDVLAELEPELQSGTVQFFCGHMIINLKDVVCAGQRLGNFQVSICDRGNMLVTSDTVYGSDEEFIHPHVERDGHVCTGTFGAALSRAMGELDVPKVVDILAQVLSNYNPDSCFQSLGTMGFQVCDFCNADGCATSACKNCGDSYCDSCEGNESDYCYQCSPLED